MDDKKHPMQTVSQRTGLSPHVIRVWERRYQAVAPDRSKTNRRFYSEVDIERLQLLKDLTDEKYRIGQIAQLPIEELRKVAELIKKETPSAPTFLTATFSQEIFNACLVAIEKLDTRKLEIYVARASMSMSAISFMESFIQPLLQEIQRRERAGGLRRIHEQAAWSVIRSFLINLGNIYDIPDTAPQLLVASPAGQYSEMGLLFIMVVAAATGWRAINLGANLAAEEMARAVDQIDGKAIALSLSSPQHDPFLQRELQQLRSLLGEKTKILAMGEAIHDLEGLFLKIGILPIPSLTALKNTLQSLQSSPSKN